MEGIKIGSSNNTKRSRIIHINETMKVTINTFILLSFLLQVYGQNGGGGQDNNGGGGSGGIIRRSKQAREKATKLREKMSIQHGSKGNMVRFCLDDDEDCNHMMQMKLNRLFEVDEC